MKEHRKMGNHIVATYRFFDEDGSPTHTIDVYGCWDKGTKLGEYDFFDIYEDGQCFNEGNPFFEIPTYLEIQDFLKEI